MSRHTPDRPTESTVLLTEAGLDHTLTSRNLQRRAQHFDKASSRARFIISEALAIICTISGLILIINVITGQTAFIVPLMTTTLVIAGLLITWVSISWWSARRQLINRLRTERMQG